MAVNPAIAMGVQPLQLADPLAQYGKFAAIQQAQNQNALAQYQLGAAQREEASQNALNEAYKAAYDSQTGAIDINKLRQTLSTGGFGSKLPAIEKSMAELQKERLALKKAEGEVAAQPVALEAARTKLVDDRLKQARSFLDTINPMDPNAPAQYIAWHEANHRDPVLGPLLTARGITVDQSRARIQQAIQQGPQAFAQLLAQSKLGTEKFMEMNKPPEPTAGMREYQEAVRQGFKGTFMEYKQSFVPKPPQVSVKLPEQEKAFETGLGKAQAERIMEDQKVAQDARGIIDTVQQGRQLLQSGAITGFGAEALTQIGSALNQIGINFAEDAVANTQAFAANMAQNVGRIIKQFGAGTGLSNADREYAEKMAGGKITLDRKAIERILDINERAARNVISAHNRRVQGIKTNVPLTVEMPPGPPAAAPIPGAPAAAAPAAAPAAPAPAPLYARNPTTGARIMSIDGGRTWNPVR